MGVMRFLVDPDRVPAGWPDSSQASVVGIDGRIHPTRLEWEEDTLTCRRTTSESGKIHLSWPVDHCGLMVVSTTSLKERETPYNLMIELARGKLSEVRDQAAAWEQARMTMPTEYKGKIRESFRLFSQATSRQTSFVEANDLAAKSLSLAFEASRLLTDSYIAQRDMAQRTSGLTSRTSLGCRIDASFQEQVHREAVTSICDLAAIPIEWRTIESEEGVYNWDDVESLVSICRQNGMFIKAGPLINLGPEGLPHWLSAWSQDLYNLTAFVCDFVETAITRFQGLVRIWEVSAFGNTGGAFQLSEEERLTLTARTLDTAVRTDSDSQFFIRVDQPWGEYLRYGKHRLTPFQFVDAMIRSNLGLCGVNLELAVGYDPPGGGERDLLGISRLIDLWSILGIPLHVTLAIPSASGSDRQATAHYQVSQRSFGEWTAEMQAKWLEQLLALLKAKHSVAGIFLSCYSDQHPHRYPHAGLLDAEGQRKAAFRSLVKFSS